MIDYDKIFNIIDCVLNTIIWFYLIIVITGILITSITITNIS